MSLSVWLRIGWLVLGADFAYWIWEWRQPEEQQLSNWHADLNIVLYYGGAMLFVVLLLVSYVLWRVNQRDRETGGHSRARPGRCGLPLERSADRLDAGHCGDHRHAPAVSHR